MYEDPTQTYEEEPMKYDQYSDVVEQQGPYGEQYDMEPPKPKKNKTKKKKTNTYYFMFDDEYYYGKLEKPIKKNDKKARFCALGKAEQNFDTSKMKTKKRKFHIPLKYINKSLDALIDADANLKAKEYPQESMYEEPVVDTPVDDFVEEPAVDAPADDFVEEPAVDAPTDDVVEEPAVDAPPADVVEEPAVDAPPADETVEEPKKESPGLFDGVANMFSSTKTEDAKGGTKKRRTKKNKSKKRKGRRA